MMQQKIVADPHAKPLLDDDLIETVGMLSVTAQHVRTLIDAVQMHLEALHKAAQSRPGYYRSAEWDSIAHLLDMIDDKADHVEDVADRVVATQNG